MSRFESVETGGRRRADFQSESPGNLGGVTAAASGLPSIGS
jgi:hypothetical protein